MAVTVQIQPADAPQSMSESAMTASSSAVGAPSGDTLWYLVSNINPTLNCTFTDVHTFGWHQPWESGEFILAGRDRKVVEKSLSGPTGIEGSFSALLHEKDENNLPMGYAEIESKKQALLDLVNTATDLALIDNHGNLWFIGIRGDGIRVEEQDDDIGRLEVSFDFIEV